MNKAKCLLLIGALLVPLASVADDVCNVCVDTPLEISQLHTGKGGTTDGQGHTEKLEKPIFVGNLYYSLDDGEKLPLPAGKGVFLKISDRKKHKLKILGESGKDWGIVRFDCNEYKYGTKIFFQNGGTYGPGWRTNPMPKNEKKCRWYPDSK